MAGQIKNLLLVFEAAFMGLSRITYMTGCVLSYQIVKDI